jgi:hypothetical protein
MTDTTTTEMKPWQHGIALERLKSIESTYAHHNSFAFSPFAQFKKNNIAEAIHDNEFVELHGATYCAKVCARDSKVVMFQDVAVALKRTGDLTLSRLNWSNVFGRTRLANAINQHAVERHLWLTLFEEDEQSRTFANANGFKKVGTKFTSFAEIVGIYFRPSTDVGAPASYDMFHVDVDALSLRRQTVPASELITLEPLRGKFSPVTEAEAADIVTGLVFSNHYSNYNKGKSWSALSLRGFSDDAQCIVKPLEMNDAWQKENAGKEWRLQWTHLVDSFAGVRALCDELSENESQIQRVRLMKLAPGGGELQRHTDQVDTETGTRDGQFMRVHVPIVTNDKVEFTAWDCDGVPKTVNMATGAAWYLDTRKPHRAVNNGTTDRIHLVVDVQSNAKLLSLLRA